MTQINQTNRAGINWGELVLGIIYLLVALICFRSPDSTLVSLSVLMGILAILSGVGEITLRNNLNKYYGDGSNIKVISGVLQIILGVLIIVNKDSAFIALPYIVAFWFIFACIIGLITALPIRLISKTIFTILLVINIIGIIIGILLIKNPLSTMLTVVALLGVYFLLMGTKKVIQAF